ncbi:uncharacterized protein KD926_009323 [Aspergillus affinis]|uniref:uncharacterized protein n=1 Tax=Aspergillus affinis TaxID=1070780 RepID=UPI0022FE9111|nr:uncharacterized protein KD926_009323 [Aspergillus affinis]KAI9039598.1 hypothetical protein KD926_009323 [Aspergillus affinis]
MAQGSGSCFLDAERIQLIAQIEKTRSAPAQVVKKWAQKKKNKSPSIASPEDLSLPDHCILEMQWVLQRLLAIAGAAEPEDLSEDDTDDDMGFDDYRKMGLCSSSTKQRPETSPGSSLATEESIGRDVEDCVSGPLTADQENEQ